MSQTGATAGIGHVSIAIAQPSPVVNRGGSDDVEFLSRPARTPLAWRRRGRPFPVIGGTMPRIDSLRMLLIEQLKDIYDAENRLTKAIPRLIKKSTHDELKTALQDHLAQTEEHVSRLEQAFEELDQSPKAKTCAGMKALIEE